MYRRQVGCLIGVVVLLAWVSIALADTVSEEAQRYMVRGMAAVEMAKTPKDYIRAVNEFEQAAKLAPNWPDVYFNLGSVQAKAGNYGEAMRHYKRYLELAPNAPDSAKVREEIYKLEYRAEEPERLRNRFIANSNGTVLDTQTNLMWAARDNGSNINWANAKSYCENYRGGGYTDWRMPTQDELAGLYDAGKSYKATQRYYNVNLTELIQLSACCPWASETRGSDAAYFNLGGKRGWVHQSDASEGRALPVRSAKLEDNKPLPGSASASSLLTGAQSGDISGPVTDADGNVYQTVKSGNQVWTVENLRTTKYDDGSAIPLVTDSAAWAALTTPGYCYYNNTTNADSIKKYGALYNWYVVNTKKLAPKGWHVPTDAEWTTLENYLIANGYNWDGTTTDNKIAKSMAAKTDWEIIRSTTPGGIDNDLSKKNRSGFSALPGGLRASFGSVSSFGNIGRHSWWWSATETDASRAYSRLLDGLSKLFRDSRGNPKSSGFSVRLLKD
jgi:uncharacterized protein (TIGR02145 family)